ncbi:MAG: HAD-IIA family hydrolase [Magnetococcales bacterium]|nr:HAD-IIA family hydrolase [Magnetococcales bacterium]
MDKKPKITDPTVLTSNMQRYREKLCSANIFLDKLLKSGVMKRVGFSQLIDNFDLILFDAYGVLNSGAYPIKGAVAAINSCVEGGKNFLVVSNNASEKSLGVWQRLDKLGFNIKHEQIITSGMAIRSYLADSPFKGKPYLLVGTQDSANDYCVDRDNLLLNPPDGPLKTDGKPAYILLCSNRDYYGKEQQKVVETQLAMGPLPLLVANPDIIVQGNNSESVVVAGYTAYELANRYNCPTMGIGKPFNPVYQLALRQYPDIPAKRILMVGDSLTTDILGGAAMGFATCLTLSGIHGKDRDNIEAVCKSWTIQPDYIINGIGS